MKRPFVVRKRPFVVRKRSAGRDGGANLDLPWAVFERVEVSDRVEERLTSAWGTRELARDAADQLNREEP